MKVLKKIDYNAPVVLSFAIVSFIALILAYITSGAVNTLLFSTYRFSMLSPMTYLRMFTHVLGHANWEHYSGNMMIILLIGPMLEEKYGSKKLLSLILLTAFITGAVNNLIFPNTALLGASGVAFMMIVLSSVTSFRDGKIPLTLIVTVILYLGGQIADGLFARDNISQLTHILGGIIGGVYGVMAHGKGSYEA